MVNVSWVLKKTSLLMLRLREPMDEGETVAKVRIDNNVIGNHIFAICSEV